MKSNILSFIIRSWWVIGFLFLCAILFERGIQKNTDQFQHLNQQYILLLEEKKKALKTQEDLQLQINSQSDPSWVELTLMKGLGVTPEDQQKVFFIN